MPVFALITALVGVVALAAWMLFVEPRRFRVHHIVQHAQRYDLPQMRILHVTDTHFHGRDGRLLGFFEHLAEREDFDLVFYTGDIIDNPRGVPAVRRMAALLRPRVGAFAVLGGHDYHHYSWPRVYWRLLTGTPRSGGARPNAAGAVAAAFEAEGVHVLRDGSARVQVEGRPVHVVGLRDAFVFRPDVRAAWGHVPEGAPVVAIAHSPDLLPQLRERGARLSFFGHTHGGQVRLPLVGAIVTRCRLPRRLARGAFRDDDRMVIVNAGAGGSAPTPFRLLCPPEVVLVDLLADPDDVTDLPELGDV